MIPFLFLAAALVDLPDTASRVAACQKLIDTDPKAAVDQAAAWADRDRNVPSRQCLGLAFVAVERWLPAEAALAQAAAQADADHDGRSFSIWSQAANAALAGDQPAKARDDLAHVLGAPGVPPTLAGEAWVDRARADVALDDLAAARTDMDKGLALVAQDPFAWYLSASLARRQKDIARAQKDIAVALKAAADDPSVQLEAGNIYAAAGLSDAAHAAWTRAAQLAPDAPEGQAAKAALAAPPK